MPPEGKADATVNAPPRRNQAGRILFSEEKMETRVAIIGIIVEDKSSVEELNRSLRRRRPSRAGPSAPD